MKIAKNLCIVALAFASGWLCLTAAMNKALLEQGICHSARACHDLLPGTLEMESEIVISFFEVRSRNESAFLAAVELALKDRVRVTAGTPITIHGFREPQEQRRRSGLVIKSVKQPFVTVELK